MNNRVYRLEIVRSFLVILVVVGHASFLRIATFGGGIDYDQFVRGTSWATKIIAFISTWIYSFHMPCFFALSGSVYQITKDREPSVKSLLNKKAFALLVPYVTVFLFYNNPIKWMVGYYDGVSLYRIVLQLLFPKGTYLWYLVSLFCVFVLFSGIRKLSPHSQLIVGLCLWTLGYYIEREFGDYTPLGNPFMYLLWFLVGYNIDGIIGYISQFKNHGIIVLCLAFTQVMLVLASRCTWLNYNLVHSIVTPILGIISTFYISERIEGILDDGKKRIIVEKISEYSLGIYLYADPINYIVIRFFVVMFGVGYFSLPINILFLYISRIVISLLIAMFITFVLKRLKIKYFA